MIATPVHSKEIGTIRLVFSPKELIVEKMRK
jgi:hypothetical protein